MFTQLHETEDDNYDLPSLLCVATSAYSYLMDMIMPDAEENGLAKIMANQSRAYLATARAAVSQISLVAPPSLSNLQALCHGVSYSSYSG